MSNHSTSPPSKETEALGPGPNAAVTIVRPRWGVVLAGAAVALLALPLDRLISAGLTADAVRPGLEQALNLLNGLAPAFIILAILSAFPNRRRLYIGFLTPLLGHLPVLHLLKWAIGRARPVAGLGAFHFDPFSAAKYCDAFPSGHTATAAVFALLLGIYFPRMRWVFYVWLALMGLDRLVLNKHFVSDVLAGCVLAGAVVYACVWLLGPAFYDKDRRSEPVNPAGLTESP